MTKSYLVLCALVIASCGKKDHAKSEPAAAGSAATAGSTPAAGPKRGEKPADLPPASAPGTAEVLAKFDAACDAGYAPACYDSGMRRAKGMGTPEDRPAALPWLEKGCNGDDGESCALMAGFYGTGDKGVPLDKAKAVALHTKACVHVPTSCRILSGYYGEGVVVPRDSPKAMALLDQACKAGDQPSCQEAAQHRADGTDH